MQLLQVTMSLSVELLIKMDVNLLLKPLDLYLNLVKWIGSKKDGIRDWKYLFITILLRFTSGDSFLTFEIVFLCTAKSFVSVMENLSILVVSSLTYVKLAHFVFNLKKINKIRETISKLIEFSYDERFKERKDIKDKTSMILMITKWYYFGCLMTRNDQNGHHTKASIHGLLSV